PWGANTRRRGWVASGADLLLSSVAEASTRSGSNFSRGNAVIERRPFAKLGQERLDWLDTHYHFSFAHYHDPKRMNWGARRVWNDDETAPGAGFPPPPHADMEIITYVRQGAVTHEDSLGNKGRTEAGDVQVMSAGSGIRHAEYNREDEPTRLFQ